MQNVFSTECGLYRIARPEWGCPDARANSQQKPGRGEGCGEQEGGGWGAGCKENLDAELVAQCLLGLPVRERQGEPRHFGEVRLERRLVAVRGHEYNLERLALCNNAGIRRGERRRKPAARRAPGAVHRACPAFSAYVSTDLTKDCQTTGLRINN
jgi:hypothetical protein